MNEDDPRLQIVAENAELFCDRFSAETEFGLAYDRESVEWAEGFIQRHRMIEDIDMREKLISLVGSFLGEVIVHDTGGAWYDMGDDGLGIRFANGQCCFPFVKVAKQFESGIGNGESILSFYDVCVNDIAAGASDSAREQQG